MGTTAARGGTKCKEKHSRQWKHRYIIHSSYVLSSSSFLVMLLSMMMMTVASAVSTAGSSYLPSSSSGLEGPQHIRRRRRLDSSSSLSFLKGIFNQLQLIPHKGSSSTSSSSSYTPPPLPRFYEVPGSEYVPLSGQQDFSFQSTTSYHHSFIQGEADRCFPTTSSSSSSSRKAAEGEAAASSPMVWTSEDGHVKLNGQEIYIKGINW